MRVRLGKRTSWLGGLAAAVVTAALAVSPTRAAAAPDLRSPFDVEVRRTAAWDSESGGGYCADIIVTNLAGNPVEWEVEVTLPGSIFANWNFEATPLGGDRYQIRGMEWNRILGPGASTTGVGYCAYYA